MSLVAESALARVVDASAAATMLAASGADVHTLNGHSDRLVGSLKAVHTTLTNELEAAPGLTPFTSTADASCSRLQLVGLRASILSEHLAGALAASAEPERIASS